MAAEHVGGLPGSLVQLCGLSTSLNPAVPHRPARAPIDDKNHRKVMDVFIKAAEYMEMPVRRSDDEHLQKLFLALRSELNLDLKNIRTEQAKFWKQHPSLVKMELLIQAHLTRESFALPPALAKDYRHMLELAPRLLEELVKI